MNVSIVSVVYAVSHLIPQMILKTIRTTMRIRQIITMRKRVPLDLETIKIIVMAPLDKMNMVVLVVLVKICCGSA